MKNLVAIALQSVQGLSRLAEKFRGAPVTRSPKFIGPSLSVETGPRQPFLAPTTSSELHQRLRAVEASENNEAWIRDTFSPDTLIEAGRLRAAKSDYHLAKKLFAQADVASYCHPDARKGYDDVCRREAESNAKGSENDDSPCQPFEFLVVHSGHAGTTAIQNFLCLHPDILVTQKSEIDTAIANKSERSLARTYRHRIENAAIPLRAGVVQHGYVVGWLNGAPDAPGWPPNPSIVDNLADVIRGDKFYHIVRHPLDSLRSSYNNLLLNQYGGGFSFPGSMNFRARCGLSFNNSLAWPSSWEIPARGRPKSWSRPLSFRRASPGAVFEPSDDECRNSLRFAFNRLKYAAVGDAYKRRFRDWVPLETGDFMPGQAHKGLSWLYGQLGVDVSYRMAAFDTLAASPARRAMLSNAINLTGLDFPLYAHLDYTAQSLYSHTFPLIELASIEPDERWQRAGFALHPVSLVVSCEQWFLQSEKTRRRILNERIANFILDKVAIPAWIACFGAWNEATSRRMIGDWHELVERRLCAHADVKAQISQDVGRFLDFHPEFHKRWPGLDEIL